MGALRDFTGQVFGILHVLERAPPAGKHIKWRCRCDCGTVSDFFATNLARGLSQSCGCVRVHHMTDTPEHRAWQGMFDRCNNPNSHGYKDWGGRGITICDRWRNSFRDFLADMGPRPSPQHSIDRKDNNGNYEPSNCRWATKAQQSRNSRGARLNDNIVKDIRASSLSAEVLAAQYGVSKGCIWHVLAHRTWA